MSKVKHTPGPWEYHEELRARMSYVGDRERVVAGIPNDTDPKEMEVTRANARLIAAAPTLLAALERALQWIPTEDEDRCEAPHALIRFVRAAIAKATEGE